MNTSLYRAADQLRYAEGRLERSNGARVNDQISLERTPAIEAVVAAAPATVAELAAAVQAYHPDLPIEDCVAFVEGLIDASVLHSELEPSVVGEDPLASLVARVRPLDEALGDELSELHATLRALDQAELGQNERIYADLVGLCARLPVSPDARHLLHVDLYRGGDLSLGPAVIQAIHKARDLLLRLVPPAPDSLAALREAFETRWGGAEQALTDVLDDERGVGFVGSGVGADRNPLLIGMTLAVEQPTETDSFGDRERWMLRRIMGCPPGGEWQLNDDDLRALGVEGGQPMPDSYAFMGTLLAESAPAIDRGEFDLLVDLDLPLAERPSLLGAWRDAAARMFKPDRAFEGRLSQRFRAERPSLVSLVEPSWAPDHPLAPGLELLANRSRVSAPVVAALHAASREGRLERSLPELAGSYVHMAINRMLRSETNAQELVLYDFLSRLYRSRLARGGAG